MPRLDLAVMDEDEEYAQMLAAFVRSEEYAGQFSLTCFSRIEAFRQHLHQAERGHALYLLHESLLEQFDASLIPGKLVLLSENIQADEGGAVNAVFKYQPLNQFFAKIASLCAESGGTPGTVEAAGGRCRVVAVYSAAGGAGKTTVALNLAQLLALQNRSVFMLNLELSSSLPSFLPSGERDCFAELLYCVRSRPQQLAVKIEQLKSYDSSTKLSYFQPPANMQELLEMSAEDVRRIVNCLAGSEAYDAIVIDLESTLHERILGALDVCDRICWIVLDDALCIRKSSSVWNEVRRRDRRERGSIGAKTCFLLNKYTGSLHHSFDDFHLRAHLPYIPEWKSASSGEQLLSSHVFNEKLAEIAAALWDEGGEQAIGRSPFRA